MGGAKETPRQKMISMMYIVLTALLALNVSKTILDAFVAIEENIQLGNVNEYARGNEKKAMIRDKWVNDKSLRAKKVFEILETLDKQTAEIIQLIDQTKLEVLVECKEEIKIGKGDKSDKTIIVNDREGLAYNNNTSSPSITNPNPIRPLRMSLEWVSGKDKYDEPMRVIGISSSDQLVNPAKDGRGMLIWNKMIEYRGLLINAICDVTTFIESSEDSVKSSAKYFFKDPMIVKYETKDDAVKQLKPSLKTVHKNDSATIKDVYLALLKNERIEHEEKMIHWIGKTFDHAPSVAVIASLSSLQKEILANRAAVMSFLQDKVGGGDYSFNQIVAIARPDNMIVGGQQEFFVTVSMAAFDSEKQPIVKPEGGELVGKPKNGEARLKFRAPASGNVTITGTVGIEKKSGGVEYRKYSTEVAVAPKSGALELPECNVLYMNYDNIIVPAAPGVTDMSLSGGVATTYEGKKAFKVKPTSAGKKTLTLSGKGSDGKNVSIGSWTYKVKEMPPPVVTTTTISKAGGRVAVAMAGGVLNVTYTIISGICEEQSFTGDRIPAAAVSKVRSGKPVSVILTVRNNKTNRLEDPVKGVLKVQ